MRSELKLDFFWYQIIIHEATLEVEITHASSDALDI